jgi:hypothetical protein
MKLGDLDVDTLVQALQEEKDGMLRRSAARAWRIYGSRSWNHQCADRATISVLHALHRALAKAARIQNDSQQIKATRLARS